MIKKTCPYFNLNVRITFPKNLVVKPRILSDRRKLTKTPPPSSPRQFLTSRPLKSSCFLGPPRLTWTGTLLPVWPRSCVAGLLRYWLTGLLLVVECLSHQTLCLLYYSSTRLTLPHRGIYVCFALCFVTFRESASVKTPEKYNAAYRLPAKVMCRLFQRRT